MDESRHTYECVRPIFLPLRVLHISLKEPKMFLQQSYGWVKAHVRMRHVHKSESVMSHMWMGHVTHINVSRGRDLLASLFIYGGLFSHIHVTFHIYTMCRPRDALMCVTWPIHMWISLVTQEKESRQKRKRKSLVTHIWMGHVTHMSGWRRVWLFHICLTRLFHICVTRLFEWVTSGIQRVSSHKCERVPLFANRY